MKKRKVEYVLRCFVDKNMSMVVEKFNDKEQAIESAIYESKHDGSRIYFVNKITEHVIFSVGERG